MSVDDAEHDGGDAAAELRQAIIRLYNRFRAERVDGEVPDAALLVLMVLDKHEPQSLSDLAGLAGVTLGSMSQTVRWLERVGYVTKDRDTQDRRKVLFSLTDPGREASVASRRHRREWLNSQLARLTADERSDIARVAPLLLRIADS